MRLHEYNVIGSAVRLDEIPPEYRKLKLLGRGATSLAFEKDPNTVLILTRDALKRDWLKHGLHMVIDDKVVVPINSHHIQGMDQIPLYAIQMPKLFPLTRENKRIVVDEIKEYTKLSREARQKANNNGSFDRQKWINLLTKKYKEEHPDSLISPLFKFLLNHSANNFSIDLAKRQFMQTRDGKIVLLDPIIAEELLNLFKDHRKRKGHWYYAN